jgi:hypothetical protein
VLLALALASFALSSPMTLHGFAPFRYQLSLASPNTLLRRTPSRIRYREYQKKAVI